MIARRFDSAEELTGEAAALLAGHLQWAGEEPYGIMLSGGRTSLPVYQRLTQHPVPVSPRVCLFHGDERMVPRDSAESNYGATAPLVRALGMSEERILRVDTGLALEEAAARFHDDLARFFGSGGRIGLGFLGLGADGHTASFFRVEDVARGAGRYAIGVRHAPGPDRVTVTRDLLLRVERIVFLVSGPGKAEVVEAFLKTPLRFPAGHAVAGARNVEVWIG